MKRKEIGRFSLSTINSLSRRAANTCSNPECATITSGPASQENKSINIGEAAHIYGAQQGSARYILDMSLLDRRDITNAIWLCRNCHRMIDRDPLAYPPELLYEWRRRHERNITSRLGKISEEIRIKLISDNVDEFDNIGHRSQQIIIGKPKYWEYKLASSVLAYKFKDISWRWEALNKKLYVKPIMRLESRKAVYWFSDRITELSELVPAAARVINGQLPFAWGAPGVSGSERSWCLWLGARYNKKL